MTTPPTITVSRAKGQPAFNPGTAFAMAIVGCASAAALPAALSPPYGNAATLASDSGIGDGVDAAYMALTKTDDNPQPPAVSFYATPATTPGVRGATLTVSGVTGTSVVTKTAATTPLGTYQPVVRVPTGGTRGTAGIVLQGSLDNGATWFPESALGTATTWKLQIPNPNGAAIDTGIQYDFAAGTLVTGDHFEESKTTPPRWVIGDLYTAGTPATGAIPAIAASSTNFALIAITEPVVAGDIATLSAALTAMVTLKGSFRPTLLVRFRDAAVGESETTFLAALATFRAACATDARIASWAGDCLLTDPQLSCVYSRSMFPSLLARIQGMAAIPGRKGERIAQSPGWTRRGPMPFASLRSATGAVTGHDERLRPGALGPFAGLGGFMCAYYEAHEDVVGTYACPIAPVLYGVLPTVTTLMDNRVSSAIERILYAISFQELGGADIVTSSILDEDVCLSMAGAAQDALKRQLATEFANATDPNLVTVDPNVTVGTDGAVSVRWYVNDRLFGYTNAITITLANGRV